jgi:hypothetical protein
MKEEQWGIEMMPIPSLLVDEEQIRKRECHETISLPAFHECPFKLPNCKVQLPFYSKDAGVKAFIESLRLSTGIKVGPSALTEHHAMKAYWGSRGIAPRIL